MSDLCEVAGYPVSDLGVTKSWMGEKIRDRFYDCYHQNRGRMQLPIKY